MFLGKVNQEDDIFKLPDAKNPLENSLDSSDEEREEQWRKRASTREAVYGAAMSVSVKFFTFLYKTHKT